MTRREPKRREMFIEFQVLGGHVFSSPRSYRKYFGPIRQAPFESDCETVFVLDTDLPGQRSLIQTSIVCDEGVLYFHAPVEIDFLAVYVNVYILIHLKIILFRA